MRNPINQILLCLMLFMGIGAGTASADNLYVITDGTNYLANVNGTLTNAESFDPKTCVWTYSSNGTMANLGGYLSRSNSTLSVKSSSTTWTINDKKVYTTSRNSTYYIYYNNGTWSLRTTSSGANCYEVTKVQTDASSSMTLNYNTGRKIGENVFEREGDSRDYRIELSYTPAYNTYSWTDTSNATTTYYASSDNSYVSETAPDAITTASSYSWSTNYPDNVTFDSTDEDAATATYETKFPKDTEVTITAQATIEKSASSFLTEAITLTAEDTVTLKSRYLLDLQLGLGSSTLYIGETTQIKYDGWYDENATITYTSSDTSIAEVSSTGVITAKGTGSSNADEARVTITLSMPQTDEYEAGSSSVGVVVKKHPTTLTLQYDKSAMNYAEEASQLTSATLTDGVDNTTFTGTLTYSSNDLCVSVNATTGALTINKAGNAIITATYQGDNTHQAATATFAITVSKATTTVSFEEANYLAQTTKTFTSPVATLTPAGAGCVTYSYTSTTDGLITLDANTGTVTLNTLTGTATVTATYAGNDCYEPSSASYVLTVTSKEIPELKVTTEIEFYVDDTYKVIASTSSNAGVTFESNDTDIVSIAEDGTLTAVGEGSAFIRITSVEDDTYMAYTADYPIMVKRYPTKIVVNYPESSYYTDYAYNIIPTGSVSETKNGSVINASGLVSFSTQQTGVLTVNSKTGQVTMVGNGTASIDVTYEGDRKYAPSTVSVVLIIKKVTSPGTFIRLKDAAGNYLSSDGTTVNTSATADATNIIWYGTDRSLLFYQCGRYLNDATPALMVVGDAGVGGTKFSFTHHDDKYTISDGTNTLTSNGSTLWTMEEVSYLPVTFKSAGYGYSTLYSPVDLSCPAGVVAYYPTERKTDDTGAATHVITLKSLVGGYIPHSTPIVLQTNYVGTYKFYIVDEDNHNLTDLWNGMTGTFPTITTSSVYSGTQWPYTLQPTKASESVGFYPWKSDKHDTIDPFRCYIPGVTASQSNGFRFVIDDSVTGINDIRQDAASEGIIYNLQGIAVGNDLRSLPAGVYLRNGKKVIKK